MIKCIKDTVSSHKVKVSGRHQHKSFASVKIKNEKRESQKTQILPTADQD